MKKYALAFCLFLSLTTVQAQISEQEFKNPPASARPHTYWMWMNGNVSQQGITLDLESMSRTGVGGAFMFNSAVGIPRGSVDYASPQWDDMVLHTCKEAKRLGLELTLQNSPGYSGTGGPWITPEMSMQELVWSESLVHSKGKEIRMKLPQPTTKMGYYRDAYILAYPSLTCEKYLAYDELTKVTVNGKVIDKDIITGGNVETKIRMDQKHNELLMEFAHPFEARAISVLRFPEEPRDPHDGPRDYPPRLMLEVSDDGIYFRTVCRVNCPALRAMDAPGIQSFEVVTAKYYRLVTDDPTWICDVNLHSSPRLRDWLTKTNYSKGDMGFADNNDMLPDNLLIDPATVIDITDKVDAQGNLIWNTPKGNWTIVRLGYTTTGEVVAAAPNSGIGLECDKYSKKALDLHFDAFLGKLLDKLSPYVGTTLKSLTMDSWEAGKQNWTAELPAFFKQARGYDLRPYVLAMTGRVVGSVVQTERFLWDMRRTHADMIRDNYFAHFAEKAHSYGLKFYAESYGDGPFESMEYGAQADIPMGEFWTRYIYGSDNYVKQAASIAHTTGKPIVAAEGFTGTPFTSKFTEYPYAMKGEGDQMLSFGLNRLVFHTFAHQPNPQSSVVPGMTMGPFGTHMDRNSTWAEQAIGFNTYMARSQYILQQGLNVADVCYFKDEAISAGIPDPDKVDPKVPFGYGWDVLNWQTLLNSVTTVDGKVVLPYGMTYSLFVFPSVKEVTPEVLRKLKELVNAGMWLIVDEKPQGFPGLDDKADAEVKALADELWSDLDTEKDFGKGKIFRGVSVGSILKNKGLAPDFEFTAKQQDAVIHRTHRSVNGTEVYFVSSQLRRPESIVATFRVSGLKPELWNAETGEITKDIPYEEVDGRTRIQLNFTPVGSWFVVFRDKVSTSSSIKIANYPAANPAPYTNVKQTFTVFIWAKPDTYAAGGKGYLFYPPQGEDIYGKGHATIGLAAGQNGIFLYERTKGGARQILKTDKPLEGWTHIVLIYNEGIPAIYVNGEKRAQGSLSSSIVHPGLQTPACDEQYMSFFEGDQSPATLFEEALSENIIRKLYASGFPDSDLPLGTESFLTINTDWTVQFPKASKAPAEIQLPVLQSLRKQENFDVKHFSGTATYLKQFKLTKKQLSQGKIYLDLGRVENIASVKVNGVDCGLLWKAPFSCDITKAIYVGMNQLEVKVTNLYPNRLIGDEYLPQENEYDVYRRIKQIPDWYTKGEERKGERVLFCTWRHYDKTDPLLESGLLGPVRLLTNQNKIYK